MGSAISIAVVSTLLAGVLLVVAWQIKSRYVSADANEWLLLIKDGKLRKGAVGITVFRGIGESVVKFPSLLNKVTFSAQQVSKEMQGVELSGFIIWVCDISLMHTCGDWYFH